MTTSGNIFRGDLRGGAGEPRYYALEEQPAGPGSGAVARMESTRAGLYSGRLDKGPHAGRWIRLAVTDDGVGKTFIGDTEADTRRQMEAEFGGPRSSDL
jgi:hypothetical protein